MKNSYHSNGLFLICFLLMFFFTSPKSLAYRQNCKILPEGCIAVYEDIDFGGNYTRICIDSPNLRIQYNLTPKLIKSIQLGPKTFVAIFHATKYRGDYRLVTNDNDNLDFSTKSILINPNLANVKYIKYKPSPKNVTKTPVRQVPSPVKITPVPNPKIVVPPPVYTGPRFQEINLVPPKYYVPTYAPVYYPPKPKPTLLVYPNVYIPPQPPVQTLIPRVYVPPIPRPLPLVYPNVVVPPPQPPKPVRRVVQIKEKETYVNLKPLNNIVPTSNQPFNIPNVNIPQTPIKKITKPRKKHHRKPKRTNRTRLNVTNSTNSSKPRRNNSRVVRPPQANVTKVVVPTLVVRPTPTNFTKTVIPKHRKIKARVVKTTPRNNTDFDTPLSYIKNTAAKPKHRRNHTQRPRPRKNRTSKPKQRKNKTRKVRPQPIRNYTTTVKPVIIRNHTVVVIPKPRRNHSKIVRPKPIRNISVIVKPRPISLNITVPKRVVLPKKHKRLHNKTQVRRIPKNKSVKVVKSVNNTTPKRIVVIPKTINITNSTKNKTIVYPSKVKKHVSVRVFPSSQLNVSQNNSVVFTKTNTTVHTYKKRKNKTRKHRITKVKKIVEPTPRPIYIPAPRPIYVPAPRPIYVPAHRPIYIPAPRPIYVPAHRPIYIPAPRPIYVPAPRPIYVPAPRPIYVPAPRPIYVPAPKQVVSPPKQVVPAPKQVVTPPKQVVTPPKQVVAPPKQVVTPPKQVVAPPKQVVTPPKQVVAPPKQVVSPPKQVVSPPKQVVSPPKQVVSPPKQVVSPPKQVVSPPKQVVSPPKQVLSPPKQVVSPPKQVVSPPKQVLSPPKQVLSPPKRVVKEPTPQKKPEPAYNDESARRIGYMADDHKYEWDANWSLPKVGNSMIRFYASAKSDITIGISPSLINHIPMYEIVIGSDDNSSSKVKRNKDGKTVCEFPGAIIPKTKMLNRYNIIINQDNETILVKVNGQKLFTCQDDLFIKNLLYYAVTNGSDSPVYYYNIKAFPNQKAKAFNPFLSFSPVGFEIFNLWKDEWRLPHKAQGSIIFSTKARHDVVVAVSPIKGVHRDMYKIIIGAEGNTVTTIQRGEFGNPFCSSRVGINKSDDVNNFLIIVNKRRNKIAIFDNGIMTLTCHIPTAEFSSDVLYYSFSSLDNKITYYYIGSVEPQIIPERKQEIRYDTVRGKYNITTIPSEKKIIMQDVKVERETKTGVITTQVTRPVLSKRIDLNGKIVESNTLGFSVKNSILPWKEDWALPENGLGSILFTASGSSKIHVVLSEEKSLNAPLYEFILGDQNNKLSTIQKNGKTLCKKDGAIKNLNKVNNYRISVNSKNKSFSVYQNSVRLFKCFDFNFLKSVKWFNFAGDNKVVNYFNIRSAQKTTKKN